MKKTTLFMAALLAGTMFSSQAWAGTGTQEDPYTVAEAQQNQDESTAWVKGFIVGGVPDDNNKTSEITSNDNVVWGAEGVRATAVLIADSKDVKEYTQCVIVNLKNGSDARKIINLADNPDNLGKEVKVCGTLKNYFKIPGVRDVESQFELEGYEAPDYVFYEPFSSGQGDFVLTFHTLDTHNQYTGHVVDGNCSRFLKNNVQIVVAINKCDAKGANVDRVKQQMQQRGITSEDWGGSVLCEAVSALKGTNMEALLDAILLQAEVMELKANPRRPAEGVVVEAQMEQGRGPTATVIVQRGTLKTGDAFVCAQHFCRVRAILDEYGKPLKSVAPGNPGRVLGWSGVPSAGAVFSVVKNAREAEKIAEENKYKLRKAEEAEEEEAKAAASAAQKGMSDMDLLNSLLKESNEKVFRCVLKADVDGTLEALEGALLGIKSKRVKIEVVGGSVGPITPGDVNTAAAANAVIVAFDVKQENSVPAMLKRLGVKVIAHDIIYMLLDMVKEAMAELLDPEYKENAVGEAEVRAIFSLGKNNNVAGSMVLDGSIRRDFNARVVRKGEVLHTGKIDTLKRFKDDVTEVKAGYECGIRVTGFDEYQEGDRIECFEILEVRPSL